MVQLRRGSSRYGTKLGVAAVGFFLLWVVLIISGVLPRHLTKPDELPNLLLGGLVDEAYGGIERYVDTKVIPVTDNSKRIWDRRTGFKISVLDLGSLTDSCPTHIVVETPKLMALSEGLLVFVVEKKARKIEAITTMPDFEERGTVIMAAVSRGLPTIPANQARRRAGGDGHEMAGRFSGKRLRNLVARFRDLCEANELGKMQSMVDPLRILVDSRHGIVIDLRTGYRISFERIKSLRDTCPVGHSGQDGPVRVIVFCEHTGYRETRVIFLLSPDWKIRAIMDEATWESRGEEILAEIRKELSAAGEQDQPAGKGSPRIPETSGEGPDAGPAGGG